MRYRLLIVSVLSVFAAVAARAQTPLTTVFTYQGELASAGTPATGTYDIRYQLYDAAIGGTQIGGTLCSDNVAVVNGRFTASLDFGAAAFAGQRRFLEIAVRADTGLACSNAVGYTVLSPRQELAGAPNALFALSAATATTSASATNASSLNGQDGAFYRNAANLTGVLADSRLSANVAQLNLAQTFTSTRTFAVAPSFSTPGGPPFLVSSNTLVSNLNADLLDGLSASAFAFAAHTHDAAAINAGTLSDARLSANIPRLNAGNTFLGATTFSAATTTVSGSLGVGTATPGSILEVRNFDPQFRIRNGNDTGGGVILNTFGSMQLGMFNPSAAAWNTVPANGYRSVFALDSLGKVGSTTNTGAGPVFRNVLDDGSGRLGVGTAAPEAPLDVRVTPTQGLQVRLDGGVPGINVLGGSAGNAGILRLRNDLEVWPSDDGIRAGAIVVRNSSGASSIVLNGLDGTVYSARMPAIKFAQTNRDARNIDDSILITQGQNADVQSITVNVPTGGGYLHMIASANLDYHSSDPDIDFKKVYLKLTDVTSGTRLSEVGASGEISSTSPLGNAGGTQNLVLQWTVFAPAGQRTYSINVYNDTPGWTRVWTTTITVTFFAQGL